MITWTAYNNGSFLNGSRQANTVRSAVRDGKRYIDGELYGVGILCISKNGQLIRRLEKSIFTGFRWKETI